MRLLSLLLLASLFGVIGCNRARSEIAPDGSPPGTATGPSMGIPPGGVRTDTRTNPYKGNAAALKDGREAFNAFNCSGCHGGHAGGGMGPSLRDDAWIYGGSAGQIFDSISQGRTKGMPAWGTLLPSDMIWKLTAYIQSLGTPQEADPPQ